MYILASKIKHEVRKASFVRSRLDFCNCCKPLAHLISNTCVFLQCKKYRSRFTEERKAVYEEKLEASEIFKDKKALYPSR